MMPHWEEIEKTVEFVRKITPSFDINDNEPFLQSAESSSTASFCHTLNLWPTVFSQAWIHITLWELVSQDIHDETYGYIFCKFFPCNSFDNKHMLFSSELHFSINIDCLSTPLTQTDY
jgi:hypothetical protein